MAVNVPRDIFLDTALSRNHFDAVLAVGIAGNGQQLGFVLTVRFPLNPLFTTFLRSAAQSLIFYSYLFRRKTIFSHA